MNKMKIAYFYITEQGRKLAETLNHEIKGTLFGKEDLQNNMKKAFSKYDGLVCIMATGIVVRILAPLFMQKQTDPAIVVMDSKGEFAISLLSGHLGGANELAEQMAAISGGKPVITTATDVEEVFAFDLFAKKHNLTIENIEEVKWISSELLRGHKVQLISMDSFEELTPEIVKEYDRNCSDAVVVISDLIEQISQKHVLYLRPASLWVGIGCKAGVSGKQIRAAISAVLEENKLSVFSLRGISTIPKKENEPGILETAMHFGMRLAIIPNERIRSLDLEQLHIKQSDFVEDTVGVPSVSTASAYLAADFGEILVDKAIFEGITVSVVRMKKRVYDKI